MIRRELAELVCKLLSLSGIFYSASQLISVLICWHFRATTHPMQFQYPATQFVAGIILFFAARPLARWLVPDTTCDTGPSPIGNILSLGGFKFCVRLMGLYFLFRAIGDVVATLGTFLLGIGSLAHGGTSFQLLGPHLRTFGALLGLYLQLGIAFYFLTGAKRLVQFAWKTQNEI